MSKNGYLVAGLIVGLCGGFVGANQVRRGPAQAAPEATSAQPAQPAVPPGVEEPPPPSEEEIVAAMRTVDGRPDSYEDQMKLARALVVIAHRPKDAIKYYKRASELRPDDVEPIIGLGNAHFDAAIPTEDGTGTYDSALLRKAAEYYEKALAMNPNNPNTRTDLGLTYFLRQPPDPDRAIAEYQKSLAIDPKHAFTLRHITAALIVKGDLKAAESHLIRLVEAAPNHPAIHQLRSGLAQAQAGLLTTGVH